MLSLHPTHAKPGTLTKAKKNGSKIAVANAAATVRHHHQKYLYTGGGGGQGTLVPRVLDGARAPLSLHRRIQAEPVL